MTALAAAAHGDACGERVPGRGHWPYALIIRRAVSRAFLGSAARAVTMRQPLRQSTLGRMEGGVRARAIVAALVPAPNELYGMIGARLIRLRGVFVMPTLPASAAAHETGQVAGALQLEGSLAVVAVHFPVVRDSYESP